MPYIKWRSIPVSVEIDILQAFPAHRSASSVFPVFRLVRSHKPPVLASALDTKLLAKQYHHEEDGRCCHPNECCGDEAVLIAKIRQPRSDSVILLVGYVIIRRGKLTRN